ncbi:MAG: hypothetical protein IJT44_03160 [Clostridia bacterium]|nr:hypothetical protein [Clostridia bacterium]
MFRFGRYGGWMPPPPPPHRGGCGCGCGPLLLIPLLIPLLAVAIVFMRFMVGY